MTRKLFALVLALVLALALGACGITEPDCQGYTGIDSNGNPYTIYQRTGNFTCKLPEGMHWR